VRTRPASAEYVLQRAASLEQRVLIVDDEVGICWALDHFLRRGGSTVTTTASAAEALALLDQRSFAVVFVDAKLPDLDGLEFAALARQKAPEIFIVLISGYLDSEDSLVVEGMRKRLFDHFMAKPFDLREVRRITQQAFKT